MTEYLNSGYFKAARLFLALLFAVFLPYKADSQVIVAPKTVRIGMAQDISSQEFSVRGEYRLVDRENGNVLAYVLPGESWEIKCEGSELKINKSGVRVAESGSVIGLQQVGRGMAVLGADGSLKNIGPSDTMSVISSGGNLSYLKMDGNVKIMGGLGLSNFKGGEEINLVTLKMSGRPQNFRGDMEFRAQGQGVTVINELPLEEYLYGVLPREMPASWPMEALKAQAVTSRTFAISRLGTYSSYGYDLLATQMSQMYGGYDAEHPNGVRAVNETAGQILTNRGKPISAFFHSSSGGYIEDSGDVWKEPLEYIRAKADPYDRNTIHYNWAVTYDRQKLVDQLNSKSSLYNKPGQPVKIFKVIDSIDILEKTASGARVKKICITGQDAEGKALIVEISNADAVRMALGLKSSLFTMQNVVDSSGKLVSITLTGSGYGHGLGMSQYGACGMADQGYNYQDILKYYYNNCSVGPLSGVE
ncbi:MAG: SpoIID/LytB domain-containing protein [Bacillota bacterium]